MHVSKPSRATMDHSPPFWDPYPEWFITICAKPKGQNQLCDPEIGAKLLQATEFFHRRQFWTSEIFLLMPDHVHALISIPTKASLADVVGRWKQWTSRKLNITWQKNFFDHRLRSYPSANSKFRYIEQNPVRAGLVRSAEDWPFVFRGSRKPRNRIPLAR